MCKPPVSCLPHGIASDEFALSSFYSVPAVHLQLEFLRLHLNSALLQMHVELPDQQGAVILVLPNTFFCAWAKLAKLLVPFYAICNVPWRQ